MINPVKTAVKCCGCIVLTQLIGILVTLGALAAFILAFYLYVIPWGEDQIRDALKLGSDVDIGSLDASVVAANNCSGCVFGVNTDWPTNTTGTLHFLDTRAGPTASAVIATSLAAGAAAGAASMLWASIVPSMASVLSFSSGFYEMTHILEQAQFIGMISQLQIDGAPVFLHQFSREMAWTNFNVPKAVTDAVASTSRSRRLDTSSLLASTASGETGPKRYAALIGVAPERLFFYTLLSFAIVVGAVHALFFVGVLVFSAMSKKESFGEVAGKLYRKVVWAVLLALLLAQYIFSMAGSYYLYENAGAATRDRYFTWGAIGLALVVGFAIAFGVLIIGANREELEDLGTYEHDQRPFAAKYGAYYDEYNFDNRFFFVPRILLAVSTGAVVGTVQDATTQLLCILGITLLYLVLLLAREPHLLRFLYYIGITSVFLKVVLLCMMLMLVQDDFFPQSVRDNVAYGIIGVNMFIFFLLFLRQAYSIGHKLVRGCKNKDKARRDSSDDDADDVINLERGNGPAPTPARNPPYARMDSSNALDQSGAAKGVAGSHQSGVQVAQNQPPQGYRPNNFNNSNSYDNNHNNFGNNNNNAAANAYSQQQQSAYTQPFARDSVGYGGVQRSPYERPSSDSVGVGAAAAAAGGAAGAAAGKRAQPQDARYSQGDWSRPDARGRQQTPQQFRGSTDAAVGAGVAVGAGAAAGAAVAAGARGRRSGQKDAAQFGKPLRKASIDLDDLEADDVVAEPPALPSAAAAAVAAGAGGRDPVRANQSYLRFSDSDMSSVDDDIDGRSPRSIASSAAGARAAPASSTSLRSASSAGTEWFAQHSRSDSDAQSSVAMLASQDSYLTDTDVGTGHSQLSATTGGELSATAGVSAALSFEDAADGSSSSSSDDDEDIDGREKRGDSDDDEDIDGREDRDVGAASRDVDIDIDDSDEDDAPVSLAGLATGDSFDSYATGPDADASARSLATMDSGASSTVAAAYLRSERDDGGSDSDSDGDAYRDSGSYGRGNANDSFMSALSTRSDEDAQFYIDGQRRNTGSPAPAAGALGADGASLPRPKKL